MFIKCKNPFARRIFLYYNNHIKLYTNGEYFMAQRFFPNGLRLGITESSSEKLVCVAVHIIGGSQSETNYQSGVGEFLARILLCGTQNNPSKAP